MDYEVGNIGRVIVARGCDGEDVYGEIEGLARKENVRNAAVILLGGLRKGKVVVGPKKSSGPIEPIYAEFDDAREVMGIGTIFWDDKGPKLHLHAGIGRESETFVGCPRGGASIFLVLEVVMFEIVGFEAGRRFDPASTLTLLSFGAVK